MIWTPKQKEAFLRWQENLKEKNKSVLPSTFLDKSELTNEDVELLRSMPGFADVESQIVPQSKYSLAEKLAQNYKSISDIPEEYLKSFKEDGVTDSDIEQAFKEKDAAENFRNLTAEQEQRKKDLEEAQEIKYPKKSIAQNALAIAHKLTPKEADRHYIQYGLKDNGDITSNLGLVSSALLGAAANGLELLPFPLLGTVGAPALRLAESAKSELPYSLWDAGKDAGLNALGYAPIKQIGALVKSALGNAIGPSMEKSGIGSAVDSFFGTLDNASLGDKMLKNRLKLQEKYLNMFYKKEDIPKKGKVKVQKEDKNYIPNMDKIKIEKTARKMEENGFPGLANTLRDYNVTTQGGIPISLTEEAKSDLLYPNRYVLSADKKKLLYNDENAKNMGKQVKMPNLHSTGTKKNRQAAIDRAVALSPNQAMKIFAKTLDYVARPALRYFSNPEVPSNIIRQWEAGFEPREGTDLYEQYLLWKENVKNKGDK